MIRGAFGFGFAVTLMAASLLGAAFAWSTSSSTNSDALVGTNSMLVLLTDTGNPLGPNGNTVIAATAKVKNTGNFSLKVVSGSVTIDAVHPGLPVGACGTGDLTGSLGTLPVSFVQPGATSSSFNVNITTLFGAPEGCQGDDVDYTVLVNASNPAP